MIDTWHFTLNIQQPELSLHVIVDYDLHTVNSYHPTSAAPSGEGELLVTLAHQDATLPAS